MNQPPTDASRSHEFQFPASALAVLVAPTLVAFSTLVIALHLLNGLDWLPAPQFVESPEHILIRERARMTRTEHPAEVVIIGDSSSAIGVVAPRLGELLPGRLEVLNQGLFMGVGMDLYGQAAGEFIRHQPGRVRLVLLVVTVQKLQNTDMSPLHEQLWRDLLTPPMTSREAAAAELVLALPAARERLLNRVLPVATYGQAGWFYGFTHHLRTQFAAHNGTMVEDGSYNPTGRVALPEFQITEAVHAESLALRSEVPASVKLAVAITPLPESHLPRGHETRRDDLLQRLNTSLLADFLLTNLPVRLPNGYFSSPFHLNPRGANHFTRLLAAELGKLPVWDTNKTGVRHNEE
jgi:hypothetical protein